MLHSWVQWWTDKTDISFFLEFILVVLFFKKSSENTCILELVLLDGCVTKDRTHVLLQQTLKPKTWTLYLCFMSTCRYASFLFYLIDSIGFIRVQWGWSYSKFYTLHSLPLDKHVPDNAQIQKLQGRKIIGPAQVKCKSLGQFKKAGVNTYNMSFHNGYMKGEEGGRS